tara:strand:+ start:556 stop:2265 length:1710 start_codon:yes stop_codon:yes gene_type:complete
MKSLLSILKFIKTQHKFKLFLITSAILISGLLEVFGISLIIPILSQLIYPENNLSNYILSYLDMFESEFVIFIIFCLIILIFFIKNIFLIFANWQIGKFSAEISYFTTNIIIKNYLSLDYLAYKKESTSNLIKNIQSEASILGRSIINILSIYSEIVILIFLIVLITIFKPVLFYSIIISMLFGYLIFFFSKGILLSQGKKRQLSENSSIQLLNDLSRSYQEIKISDKKNFFLEKILKEYYAIVKSVFYSGFIQGLPRILFELILLIGILIFGLVIYHIYGSYKETFLIISFFSVVSLRVIPSINRLVYNLQQITFFSPVIKNVENEFKKIKTEKKEKNLENIVFDNLKFEKVNFKYNESSKQFILKDINIVINSGDSICIMGPSGSGKSTLLNLIMGFIRPNGGKITINNNINNYENISWFRNIGYVSQSNFLIEDSIKKNVALGYEDKDINEKKVIKCLIASGLKDYLESINSNIDLNLGEEGKLISAGQKQRICIARALYNDPSVLILDEATSSLDQNTEKQILENLASYENNVTKIIVSHREMAKNYCKKIINLENGELKIENKN